MTGELSQPTADISTARRDGAVNRAPLHSGRGPTVVRHLPWPTSALVDRPDDVARVIEAISRPRLRLVTLVGPPGTGKTQLALAAAERLIDEFPDGVYFVDLAPIRDPRLVGATIAQALGISDMGDRQLEGTLREVLAERQILLVLDNFEQLVMAGSLIVDLLANCPGLKALITSRAPLHVSSEHQLAVPPLPVPNLGQLPSLAELATVPSVALFALRAMAVRPEWRLEDDNVAAVAALCARVDGLPLAIELAAAWMKVLPPKDLVPRLSRGLDVLVDCASGRAVRSRAPRPGRRTAV